LFDWELKFSPLSEKCSSEAGYTWKSLVSCGHCVIVKLNFFSVNRIS